MAKEQTHFIGKAKRLEQRRKKGPSLAERWRGPNGGAWQNTFLPIRTNQKGLKSGIHREGTW